MTEDILEIGIRAARAGNLAQARSLLAGAVQQNPASGRAWFWLGRVLDEPDKKKFCFQKALELDPGAFEVEAGSSLQEAPNLAPPNNQAKDSGMPSVRVNEPSLTALKPSATAAGDQKVTVQPAPFAKLSMEAISEPGRQKSGKKQIAEKKSNSLLMMLLGLLAGCLLIGILAMLLVVSGRLDGLLNLFGLAQAGPVATPAIPVAHMLPPTWTPTPRPTVTATYTKTVEPSATLTVTLDAQGKQQSVDLLVQMAQGKINQKLYQDAIPYWDKVIAIEPNYSDAYYQRGLTYYRLSDNLYDQSEFENDLNLALSDFDQAIAIGPVTSNYFHYRGEVYWRLASNTPYRVDSLPLYTAALDNLRADIALGSLQGDEEALPDLLNQMGRCDEGLAEMKRVFAARPPSDPPDAYLHYVMSLSYLCLGQYQEALTHIDAALDADKYCDYFLHKTEILYSLDRLDDADKVITDCINGSPGGGGIRYYMRALIEYDQGNIAKTMEDLDIGYGNAWYHGGLYAFLKGRLALDSGDKDAAIALFQYAEATMSNNVGPKIQNRILSQLVTLGIKPLSPTQSIPLHITPISPEGLAKITQVATFAPIPTAIPNTAVPTREGDPVPTGYLDAIQVYFADGTGPLTLKPNNYPLFHFRPSQAMRVQLAKKIVFYLDPLAGQAPSIGKLPLQLYMFTRDGGWRMIDPVWGENVIDFPSFYIGSSGDFYIAIRNWSPTVTVNIGNAGFVISVERSDGDFQTYGLSGK